MKQGAGVVTTRARVHYAVTEYGGVANFYEKTIKERVKLLIGIAHRDQLHEKSKLVVPRTPIALSTLFFKRRIF